MNHERTHGELGCLTCTILCVHFFFIEGGFLKPLSEHCTVLRKDKRGDYSKAINEMCTTKTKKGKYF